MVWCKSFRPGSSAFWILISCCLKHCQRLAPEYSKAAKGLHPLVPLYAVDCDEEGNKGLCANEVRSRSFSAFHPYWFYSIQGGTRVSYRQGMSLQLCPIDTSLTPNTALPSGRLGTPNAIWIWRAHRHCIVQLGVQTCTQCNHQIICSRRPQSMGGKGKTVPQIAAASWLTSPTDKI